MSYLDFPWGFAGTCCLRRKLTKLEEKFDEYKDVIKKGIDTINSKLDETPIPKQAIKTELEKLKPPTSYMASSNTETIDDLLRDLMTAWDQHRHAYDVLYSEYDRLYRETNLR